MKRPTALAAVIKKELQQTFRDRRVVALLVVAPVIQLVVLGYAVNLDVEHVPTVFADEDRTASSRELMRAFAAGDAFDAVARVDRAEQAVAQVVRGDASMALVVPRGFGRDRAAGRPSAIQVLTDGSDSNRAIVAQNAAAAFALRRAALEAEGRMAAAARERGQAFRLPTTAVEPRVLYNQTLDSQQYFVPGVAAMLLLIVSLVVTAMGLAREKEMGTLEQVLVTPIRPVSLIAGKTLPYAVIGLVDLGLVLAAAMLLFDVPIRGSLLLLFVAGALYLLSVLGIGLFVSTMAKNQQQAFFTAIFFIMPAILLSGFLTPIANMPEWLQPVTLLDPIRYFVEILRGVMLKGAGWGDVLPQLAALGGMGTVIFLLAVSAMSRRMS